MKGSLNSSLCKTRTYLIYTVNAIAADDLATEVKFLIIQIRVGLDGAVLGNNAFCYKQLKGMADRATIEFRRHEELYGSWVSVNKTASVQGHEYLQLLEVRVYKKGEQIA